MGVVAVRRPVTDVAAIAAATAGAGVASVELLPLDDNHDVIRVCEVQERRCAPGAPSATEMEL